MCILSRSILLKVVGYYDLSVLSMSVIGFPKKSSDGVGGWGELYPIFFGIFGIFLTLQSPSVTARAEQGCIRSPFLFLPGIHWVMKNVVNKGRRGIRWTLTNLLEDLDLADDIALLLHL